MSLADGGDPVVALAAAGRTDDLTNVLTAARPFLSGWTARIAGCDGVCHLVAVSAALE